MVFLALLPLACASRYYYIRGVGPPLTQEDIIQLSQSGTPDEEIIKRNFLNCCGYLLPGISMQYDFKTFYFASCPGKSY